MRDKLYPKHMPKVVLTRPQTSCQMYITAIAEVCCGHIIDDLRLPLRHKLVPKTQAEKHRVE